MNAVSVNLPVYSVRPYVVYWPAGVFQSAFCGTETDTVTICLEEDDQSLLTGHIVNVALGR